MNFWAVAGSGLCVDREGAAVEGADVDGVAAADGSRLGSGVGVGSVAGGVNPWSVAFVPDEGMSGGGSWSVNVASVEIFGVLFPQRCMTLK